jgi:hypothetical protein
MQIVSTKPASGDQNVPRNAIVEVTFDEAISPASVSQSSIVLSYKSPKVIAARPAAGGSRYSTDNFLSQRLSSIVEGEVFYEGNVLKFKPKVPLEPLTEYTAVIASSIEGVSSGLLGKIYSFKFKTVSQDVDVSDIEELPDLKTVLGTQVTTPAQETKTSYTAEIEDSSIEDGDIMVDDEYFVVVFAEDFPLDIDDKLNVLMTVYDPLLDSRPQYVEPDVEYLASDTLKIYNIDEPNKFVNLKIVLDGKKVLDVNYLTELEPYYASTKVLKIKGGSLFAGYDDLQLALALYYSSLEADEKFRLVSSYSRIDVIKTYYAIYKTLYGVLLNNYGSVIPGRIKKQLGDFTLEIDNGHKVKLYNSLLAECKEAFKSVEQFILYAANVHADRQGIGSIAPGRLWSEGMVPGLNAKADTGEYFIRYIWDELPEPQDWNEYY